MAVTYDGLPIFGRAVKVRMDVNPSASQINEFFGVSGQQCNYGGTRGRVFLVEAVFVPADGDVWAQVDLLLSYDDGIGRLFSHPLWGAWPGVLFRRWEPGKILPGYALSYKVQFDGMV